MRYAPLFALVLVVAAAFAEDVPLTTCDGLPLVQVTAGGTKFSFLLDTAATSTLNLESFAKGGAEKIPVTSWNGTYNARGREVTVHDFVIGEHHLRNLRLPAVDLSAIGRACGHVIDGILGIDLLHRLGAVLDLKDQMARLPENPEIVETRWAELDDRLAQCVGAFNRGDELVFSDCLDARVVFLTEFADFHSREELMDYLRLKRAHSRAAPELTVTPLGHHLFGEEIWADLELSVKLGEQIRRMHGTLLCEKSSAVWRVVRLSSTALPGDGSVAGGAKDCIPLLSGCP